MVVRGTWAHQVVRCHETVARKQTVKMN